jgi:CRISPR system Cascade subunit CasD
MTVLLLRLAAPLQSWGTSSRFVRRNTDRVPSRSGIIGLLAAAQGRRRVDEIEDLLALRIGVRVDQPGHVERDFQTAHTLDGQTSMPLSYRFYLADAVFAVGIEGEPTLLQGIREALRRPVFTLFLGRKSCPPAGKLDHGVHDGDLHDVLTSAPWLASSWVQRNCRHPEVEVDLVQDCPPTTPGAEMIRDDPIDFDPRHRRYGWRSVLHTSVTVANPEYRPVPVVTDPHDPMALLGSAT